ncbi:MAG: hypothetical protein HYY18_00225 [Planctomycetes bacterium]|nr:hypothetical protein [Planctomycetota bacterium]
MALEPLNLSITRADQVQQIQNLFVAAERAGKAAAARETQEAGRREPASVQEPSATEGSRIHEEETGGSGAYEGPEGRAPETGDKPEVPVRDAADPEGRGLKLDITA